MLGDFDGDKRVSDYPCVFVCVFVCVCLLNGMGFQCWKIVTG